MSATILKFPNSRSMDALPVDNYPKKFLENMDGKLLRMGDAAARVRLLNSWLNLWSQSYLRFQERCAADDDQPEPIDGWEYREIIDGLGLRLAKAMDEEKGVRL